MLQGISRLGTSSKALVVVAIAIASFGALFAGKATWDQVRGLLEWVVPAWLGAVALEDTAKHIAAPKLEAARAASIAPPPPKMPSIPVTTAVMVLGLAVGVTACAASGNTTKASVYAAELHACVDKASTLEESQACRCEVAQRYKRPCDGEDGGAQ